MNQDEEQDIAHHYIKTLSINATSSTIQEQKLNVEWKLKTHALKE